LDFHDSIDHGDTDSEGPTQFNRSKLPMCAQDPSCTPNA
jgi:hypothetical protein